MKKLLVFLGFSMFLFSGINAQEEDPARMLSFKDQTQLDQYLASHKWTYDKKHVSDSIDGNFYLYHKKAVGGGVVYCAVHLEKYMHYQVFFDHKRPYSLVLDYDDFLMVPTGKSRFNESMENKVYSIKVVEFDDAADDRNKNLFFGKINLGDHKHHADAVVEKGAAKIKDFHSDDKNTKEAESPRDQRQDDEGHND